MKAVLGVDAQGSYREALNLLLRLDIPELEVKVVHVVETFEEFASFMPNHYYQHAFLHNEAETQGFVDPVIAELGKASVPALPAILYGTAPGQLQEFAQTEHADLIAVGSERKGKWGSLFFSSVTRALAISSPQSFLVAKGEIAKDGPLTAVLATDHSDYCDACIDKLLARCPRGIRKLTVVTAHWTDLNMLDMALKVSHLQPVDLYEWIVRRLKSKSDALAERFRELGVETDIRISEEEPREAIASAMKDTNADLLIMGARGHNLKDRITIGSVVMHEVVVEPYSVLVLRA